MKLTRKTAVVALASALVLSACSGGDAPEGGTTPTAGTTSETQAGTAGPGEDAATTSAAPDAAASTDDSAGTTAEMTTDPAKAAISVEEAEKIVAEVFEARHASFQEDGKKARKAQKRAFTGSALEAAQAADKLEDVDGEPAEAKAKAPMETNVLAISRADGDLPVFLLVQTVPKDGVPLLHLVASASGKDEDFRIGWESRMLPGTEIPSFDRRSVGSPVLRKGKGDLAQDPHKMLKDFTSYISWPQPEEIPEFRSHGYSPSVRRAAEDQAAAVSDQAELREKNWIISKDTKTLIFEDGTGFVMGTLLRDTRFTVRPNSVLRTPEQFTVFADNSEVDEEAVMRTMVFIGMRVPDEGNDRKRELITAREQLIDAWGS